MATSLSCTWRYSVFTSFHGYDVRKTFLSHLRKQFKDHGITMFDDEGIERSMTLPVALTQAIRDSGIYIVVLSKKYASSGWCLKELVEILKCKEAMGKIVMTVFHGVDPSDVRNQTGEFGIAFDETCARNTEEERLSWSQALTHVGNIAGEHFQNWVNEADMIEKIAKDVLDKRNITPSRDFDGMIGLEAHLKEMESLLDLHDDGVKIVAITGTAGIGKTTIARALQSKLSDRFQLTCFVDNLRGSYPSCSDEYGLKLNLQEQFLSKILNHTGLRICHLGAVKENLCDQKVFIILDNVNNLNQLKSLVNQTRWFGPGSRIVVTTENQELLQQHGINSTYHVGFPSEEEAREILCSYAFEQHSPCYGFQEICGRIAELCGNLPLALRVVGSSLYGKKENEWKDVENRLETILDREIEDVIRVGYESLDENEQILFLHIAVFFNDENRDHVQAMFADGNLDVQRGLKILVYRSLIYTHGERIVMHKLLQRMARQVIHKQEPSTRKILMDTHEICEALENETGRRAVSGITFDISSIDEVSIRKRALKRMPSLRFLKVYKSRDDGNDIMLIPAEMEFPGRLRLLDWQGYPGKCLPPTIHPENLVKLCMRNSQLKYLWQGTQNITNLKKMDLFGSSHLKELPDLSNATNLEELELSECKSLVEIPSSFSHLQKLQKLKMAMCSNLQVIPPQLNLPSLRVINVSCTKLRKFSFISTNFITVNILYTDIKDAPALIRMWPRLEYLRISKIGNLKGFTYLPTTLRQLILWDSDIERFPDCINALPNLELLYISGCTRLTAFPELPRSLQCIIVGECESLETVFCSLTHTHDPRTLRYFDFTNCFKLNQEVGREIIKHLFSGWAIVPGSEIIKSKYFRRAIVPGREMHAKFNQRAKGNILTIQVDGNIPLSSLSQLQVCVVLSPNHKNSKCNGTGRCRMWCYRIGKCELEPVCKAVSVCPTNDYRDKHLSMFQYDLQSMEPYEVSNEKVVLKFRCGVLRPNFKECGCLEVIECGAYIKTKETIKESCSSEVDNGMLSLVGPSTLYDDSINAVICEPKEEKNMKHKKHCFDLYDFARYIYRKLGFRKERI